MSVPILSCALDQASEWVPYWQRPQPKYLQADSFTATTTLEEKVTRGANVGLFALSLYGACFIATGGTGLLAYTSMVAMLLVLRKVAGVIVGYAAYPAAFTSLPFLGGPNAREGIRQTKLLEENGFIVKKVKLYKSGTRYDAVIVTKPGTMRNKSWSIHALGNCMTLEGSMELLGRRNYGRGFNTLIINGPSVGESGGWPTRYQLGAGYEAGLQFLEQKIKARQIAMNGYSLGGGMAAEGICQHDFQPGMEKGIRYLGIFQRTFSDLSSAATSILGEILRPVFYITGAELDVVKGSQRLSELGIPQVIVQHSSLNDAATDGVIPDCAGLERGVRDLPSKGARLVLASEDVDHNSSLPSLIESRLNLRMRWLRWWS